MMNQTETESTIWAAIDALEATDDEKATLRFADWGYVEGSVSTARAAELASERLAILRTEDAQNHA